MSERVLTPRECVEAHAGEWLTIGQAAELLSVSRRTVYNWIDAGKVAAVRTPGGSPRVARAGLLLTPDAQGAAICGTCGGPTRAALRASAGNES